MKQAIIILILLVFFSELTFAQSKTSLVGTWKLVGGKITINDTTNAYSKSDGAIKIVTPTHFAVLSQNVTDSSFNHAGAGTVKMDAKNYTEEIKYDNEKTFIGKTAKYTYKLEGDKWYIKGGFDNFVLEEEWQRVQ